jgi:alcohol dehydrogenase class IV
MKSLLPAGYDFLAPRRIVFGWGRRKEVGELAATLGRRAFIVPGARAIERSGVLDEIQAGLQAAGVRPVVTSGIHREPEVEDVDRLSEELRRHDVVPTDLVIGLGGGAALDLAKAAAAMATNAESPTVVDYLEGVGRGLQLSEAPLPVLAMPTTAGTGSEATKNAVISGRQPPFKKSLRSDRLVPSIALVDPELTVTVPATTTAHTGMDALTQLIESFISGRARPIPRALALHGLELAAGAVGRAFRDGGDREARENMAHAALLSGLALANSGLGMAHGVAAALGIHCGIPHGLACAVLLPTALRVNREVRRDDLAVLGRLFFRGDPREAEAWSQADAVEACVQSVEKLCAEVAIPSRLGELGVRREQVPALVTGSRGNSMNGNPRHLDDAELAKWLEALL